MTDAKQVSNDLALNEAEACKCQSDNGKMLMMECTRNRQGVRREWVGCGESGRVNGWVEVLLYIKFMVSAAACLARPHVSLASSASAHLLLVGRMWKDVGWAKGIGSG